MKRRARPADLLTEKQILSAMSMRVDSKMTWREVGDMFNIRGEEPVEAMVVFLEEKLEKKLRRDGEVVAPFVPPPSISETLRDDVDEDAEEQENPKEDEEEDDDDKPEPPKSRSVGPSSYDTKDPDEFAGLFAKRRGRPPGSANRTIAGPKSSAVSISDSIPTPATSGRPWRSSPDTFSRPADRPFPNSPTVITTLAPKKPTPLKVMNTPTEVLAHHGYAIETDVKPPMDIKTALAEVAKDLAEDMVVRNLTTPDSNIVKVALKKVGKGYHLVPAQDGPADDGGDRWDLYVVPASSMKKRGGRKPGTKIAKKAP
jgi:hypothetical protein